MSAYCDCWSGLRDIDGADEEEDEERYRVAVYDCAALLVVARGWRKVLGRGELRARRRKHCELLMVNERRQVAFEELSKMAK